MDSRKKLRRSSRLQGKTGSAALIGDVRTPPAPPVDIEDERKGRKHRRLPREYAEFKDGSFIGKLPVEILQDVASRLSISDLAACRVACRCFARHICSGLAAFTARLHLKEPQCVASVSCLRMMAPNLKALHLVCSTRVTQTVFDQYMEQLGSHTALTALQLTFLAPVCPQLSSRLLYHSSIVLLDGLSSLELVGHHMPTSASLGELTMLTGLTRLVLDTMPAKAVLKDGQDDRFLASSRHVDALGTLKTLRHLVFPTKLWRMDSLTALTRLTHLQANGSQLSAMAINKLVKACKMLQHLSVGVDPLSTLIASGLEVVHSRNETCSLRLALHGQTQPKEQLHQLPGLIGILTGLDLRVCSLQADVLEGLACLSRLASLELNDPECLASLSDLSTLTQLTHFKLAKALPLEANLLAEIPVCLQQWRQLVSLHLDGVTCLELPPTALHHLGAMSGLRHLTLLGSHRTPCLLQLDLTRLPQSLQSLTLRYFVLSCPVVHSCLSRLSTLSLCHCRLGCMAHLKSAVEAWSGLRTLELEDMQGWTDESLLAVGQLTRLTSLAFSDMTNNHITNSGLAYLTTLTGLHVLKWFVGDMLDPIPDPLLLSQFTQLHVLHLTNHSLHRFCRWHAHKLLEAVPCCDMETL